MIDPSELWLFELVQEFDVPVCCLASPDAEDIFNRKVPKADRIRVAALLFKHVLDGNLEIKNAETSKTVSKEKIMNMLAPLPIKERRISPYYGMTPKGRKLLEQCRLEQSPEND